MGKKSDKKYYEEISNFRELVKGYESFGEHVAFKYKQNKEIKEITYKKFVEDIKK